MKVILLENVDHLGREGDIVSVKNGYGRNWLIPQRLAVLATAGAIRAQEDQARQQARRKAQERDDAAALKVELEKIIVEIEAKVGEENRIFGSVTSQQVALGLAVQGFNIDRRAITVPDDIRVLGEYQANVRIHADVNAAVKVHVVPEGRLGQ